MDERQVYREIKNYKKKYYINLLVKGTIVSFALILGLFILLTSLEFFARLHTVARGIFFFGFIGFSLLLAYQFIGKPLLFLLNQNKGISDEDAAFQIGNYFPSISDRLLNFLQLKRSSERNSLAKASIRQRAEAFSAVSFAQAIDLRQNQSYIKYLAPTFFVALIIVAFIPQVFTTGTQRIVRYQETFAPVAPFNFIFSEENLTGFKNEDHHITLKLTGASIPENVYLVHKDRRIKMASSNGIFMYTFPKIQISKRIQFEGAGFLSKDYTINVVNRPNLKNFNVFLNYPSYLKRRPERIENIGNLNLPEGTSVKWQFNTLDTDSLTMVFNEQLVTLQNADNQIFEYEKRFQESLFYKLLLSNRFSKNKDVIGYQINVIKDEYPDINLNVYQDTVLYSYLVLGGNISDDYGITNLKLYYSILDNNKKERVADEVTLPFNPQQNNQSYFYRWIVDTLSLKEGEQVEYYVKVWDNDGFNGVKSSKSGIYTFRMPTNEEIEADIAESSAKTTDEMQETLEDAQKLKEDLEDLENKLRGKKQLDWQDDKKLKELLEQKEELNQALEQLKQQFEAEKQKKERFQNQSDEIRQKVEDIQKLLDELMDEETKALYEELQRLLNEERNNEQIQDLLERINQKEENLVQELERTLELFKRMKFDYQLEESIQQLNELSQEQLELSEETSDKSSELEDISEKQEEVNQEFEEFEESLDELNEMNQDLKNPRSMQDQSEMQEGIKQEMKNALQQIQDGKRKKSSESQRNAGQQMKKMAQQMQQMQNSMEMQQMQMNLNDLRDILYNLIKLSFDQEELMKEFRSVDQTDPRFVELGQWQLDIKDDARIVEDSLLSLAARASQLGSFVTREVGEMNSYLDNSIQSIRDRKKSKAVSDQQFAMTSMNNLALMLDDVMAMMQQNLSEAMGTSMQPNGDQKMPGLSELQQQLNEQIEDLKRSGKSGRGLSEELAKLAAEQERIRKALQNMESQLKEEEGAGRNTIAEKMEETEMDLVNKQLTEQTIKRQKEILTRLLEAENAMRERELDNEREGIGADEYTDELPKAFEEYFKAKEKEVELLKTVPPKLYPYYKKEVNDYFRRIGNQKFD